MLILNGFLNGFSLFSKIYLYPPGYVVFSFYFFNHLVPGKSGKPYAYFYLTVINQKPFFFMNKDLSFYFAWNSVDVWVVLL